MNVYLVHPDLDGFTSEEVCVVKANNVVAAKEKAAKKFAKDEFFQEYVRDLSVEIGFAENFWYDDVDYLYTRKSEYRDDLMLNFGENEELVWEYAQLHFELRVRRFFEEREDYAEMYLKAFFNDMSIVNTFDEDFFKFILLKDEFKFFGGMVFKIVEFED